MRKTWIIAMAAAAVALAGCNREPQGPVAGDGLLRAAVETPTRVALSDEGAFSWQEGDAIAVSTNAGFKTFTLKDGAGVNVAAFEGDLEGVTSATVAIYPAAIAKSDGVITLPAEYNWAEGQTNAAMYCSQVSLTAVNSFKHLGGILKIVYDEIPAGANALLVKADVPLSGDFYILDGQIVSGMGEGQVKVNFAAGSNPKAFYIPVPTGEYKFSVELQKDGVTIDRTQKATSNAIKIARKNLIMMESVVGEPVVITIATAEDFIAFSADKSYFPKGSKALLTADITLPETFLPDSLRCDFDGQGHKVTFNLDIPASAEIPVGLFCNVNEGLTVKNLKVAGNIKCAKQNVGGIAGKSSANVTFENCENEVNILGEEKQTYHMGGICGDSAKGVLFKGCHNKGALTINMGSSVTNTCQTGGIVGHIEESGAMEDCVNDGEILFDAAGTARIGGMVGYINKVVKMSYKNCINNANLTSSGAPSSGYAYVGGISGYYGTAGNGSEVSYENCVNNGKIEATEGALQTRMGGIVSHGGSTASGVAMTWTLKDCTNNGDVITAGTVAKNHLGGILSMVENSATLICENLTNNAKVSVAGKGVAGGILGSTAAPESTFKNVIVTSKSVIEVKGSGTVGIIIGSPAIKTAITGKVGAATHGKNGTETVLTAENYQSFLVGASLGEGGSTEGVIFDAAAIPVQKDTTWLAEWWINDADKAALAAHYAEEAKEPGTSSPNVAANAAGNGGQYVEANKSGSGRIEFYNAIDKTSINPKARVKRTIGAMAITEFGTWINDYWLMTANPASPVAAGEELMVYFAMRANSKNTPKYWLAEIKDGDEWKPLLPTQEATFNGETFQYNVEVFFDIDSNSEVNSEVDATYTLTKPNSEIVVRITCVSLKMAGGTDDVPEKIADSVGGATENPVIMLVGERTNKNGAPITRHTGIAILK